MKISSGSVTFSVPRATKYVGTRAPSAMPASTRVFIAGPSASRVEPLRAHPLLHDTRAPFDRVAQLQCLDVMHAVAAGGDADHLIERSAECLRVETLIDDETQRQLQLQREHELSQHIGARAAL